MRQILFIKLTSLGDLIHTLPALNDAYQADPKIEFDWVIDANFADVALWHPAVRRIFRTSHRRWKKKLTQFSTYKELKNLIQTMRQTKYDLIIDGQGNFKSALLTLAARGVKAGFDRDSVREWIAHLSYQKKVSASKKMHAIQRQRTLFSQAIGYPLPSTAPNFGLKENCFVKPNLKLPSRYLVFIHNATWKTKLWPEKHWKTLIQKAIDEGFQILLPWGTLEEKTRAERLAIVAGVTVLPKLTLSEIGYILNNAIASVCVDTGLSHLAAALNIPSITLYGATDPSLIGSTGENQSHFSATLPCAPCNQKVCKFKLPLDQQTKMPPCLDEISPEIVFQKLLKLIGSSKPTLNICNK